GPVAARWIRIQVAADHAELGDASLELADAVPWRHARRLRQLADADEVVGIQLAHAMDQIVAAPGPVKARRRIPDVMRHGRRARRKDRDVGPALALKLELRALEALADLVVRDPGVRQGGSCWTRRVFQRRDLRVAPDLEPFRRRRVVTVAIDDHRWVAWAGQVW